jgi:pilus assembly protein CpaE
MPVLLADDASQARMESAMRAGARALVKNPPDASKLSLLIAELAEVRRRRESDEFLGWSDPSRFPRVISITGARGGVGKTTIAANLAVVLAKSFPGRVALLDMYTQFGDIAAMFDITPKAAIANLVPFSDEIDADLVKNYVAEHSSGVHILVASLDPLPLDAISPECLDNLLYVLRRMYRYVIIDTPPILHQSSLHVLASSNLVLLVSNLFDVATAADTKKLYDALAGGHVPKENMRIVLNQVSKTDQLRAGDVAEMFDSGILGEIPNDERLITAANQGVPLALVDRNSPFMQSMSRLARDVTEQPCIPGEAEAAPSGKRIFNFGLRRNHERA